MRGPMGGRPPLGLALYPADHVWRGWIGSTRPKYARERPINVSAAKARARARAWARARALAQALAQAGAVASAMKQEQEKEEEERKIHFSQWSGNLSWSTQTTQRTRTRRRVREWVKEVKGVSVMSLLSIHSSMRPTWCLRTLPRALPKAMAGP